MLTKAHSAERVCHMANSTQIIRNVNLNYAKVHKAVKNDYDKVLFDIQIEFTKDRIAEMSQYGNCLLYTSPSPRDRQKSRMPSSA